MRIIIRRSGLSPLVWDDASGVTHDYDRRVIAFRVGDVPVAVQYGTGDMVTVEGA